MLICSSLSSSSILHLHHNAGKGQYQPDTSSGKKLLAHELAHVEQGGGEELAQRKMQFTHPLGFQGTAIQFLSSTIAKGVHSKEVRNLFIDYIKRIDDLYSSDKISKREHDDLKAKFSIAIDVIGESYVIRKLAINKQGLIYKIRDKIDRGMWSKVILPLIDLLRDDQTYNYFRDMKFPDYKFIRDEIERQYQEYLRTGNIIRSKMAEEINEGKWGKYLK